MDMMHRAWILALCGAALLSGAEAQADSTSVWEGHLRLGGVIKDETGDVSLMQETFNIYEGFSVSSIYLKGRFDDRSHLRLDVSDINRDNRRGYLEYRRTGVARLYSRYDESRFIFDPDGAREASRRDWWTTLSLTPSKRVRVSGDYNLQTRRGERIGFPAGTESALGDAYDSNLNRWRIEAQGTTDRGAGATVAYDGVSLSDELDARSERDGYVVSANLHLPRLVVRQLTHVVRGSLGRNEVKDSGLGYDLKTIQYTGLFDPVSALRLSYRFHGARVEDEATVNRTDRYIHDVDAVYRAGRVAVITAGYGWEAWDDDRSVTTYDNIRAALTLRDPKDRVSGRIAWSTRNKEDDEDLTLLRDTEYARVEARIDAKPMAALSVGARAADRTRKMPDVDAEASGRAASVYGRYAFERSGERPLSATLGVDYRYADDDYDNRVAAWRVRSHVVTGRIDADLRGHVTAGAAVTYMSLEEDLDIEKSVLSFNLGYRFDAGFDVDVKYNTYNFDDYLVPGRFYTANVVWITAGYAFASGGAR